MTESKCKLCGCTESNACITEDGPCGWVDDTEKDLCTACLYKQRVLVKSKDHMQISNQEFEWKKDKIYELVNHGEHFTLTAEDRKKILFNSAHKEDVLNHFDRLESIPTIAFKALNKEDRYLCDGLDCADWSDEELDTQIVTDFLFVIRDDFTKPGEEDIQNFYSFMSKLKIAADVDFIKTHYVPVEIELSQEQLNVVRERNEW